jgi:hypothetical protein
LSVYKVAAPVRKKEKMIGNLYKDDVENVSNN